MLQSILRHIELAAGPLMGPVNAMSRLRSLNRTFSSSRGFGALWIILALGVLTVGGIILGYVVAQRREQTRAQWEQFRKRAAQLGLGDEEGGLLRNMAVAAELKNPDTIFTSEDAFFRGLNEMENAGGGMSVFGKARTTACSSCRFFQSLQEKLGFTRPEPGQNRTDGPSLGPIKAGVTLNVVRQQEPQDFEVQLAANGDEPGQLTVSCRNLPHVEVGESWMLRYPDGGILWEFNARVIRLGDDHIFLRPSGEVRYVDRRRFNRVPVSRPARVAPFPFERHNAGATPPRFAPARLLELAGPGVLLEAEMHADKGDKVLVVIELDDRSVEGLGVVRRGCGPDDDGPGNIAIELVALSTSQVAELARETNALVTREAVAQRLQQEQEEEQKQLVAVETAPREG